MGRRGIRKTAWRKDGFRRLPANACRKQAQPEEAMPNEYVGSTNGDACRAIGGNAHHTNLRLCSDTIGAINPDIFSKDRTPLVEFHVLHELAMTVSR